MITGSRAWIAAAAVAVATILFMPEAQAQPKDKLSKNCQVPHWVGETAIPLPHAQLRLHRERQIKIVAMGSSSTKGSWQTALAQTVQAGGQVYADQVMKSIQDDGVYVRVPAGKQFYLYVTQTVDLTKSTRGGSQVAKTQEAESQ